MSMACTPCGNFLPAVKSFLSLFLAPFRIPSQPLIEVASAVFTSGRISRSLRFLFA